MSGQFDPSLKTYCLITGGTRGFGRSLATVAAARLVLGSKITVTCRKFTEGDRFITELAKLGSTSVEYVCLELGVLDRLESKLKFLFSNVKPGVYDQAMLINNAGSLGPADCLIHDLPSTEAVQLYFNLNVVSMISLTSRFMALFADIPKVVVQVTSLCALQPMPSLSLYCTGKAARDMFMKVLAEEDPSTKVLNFSPGPMLTDTGIEMKQKTANDGIKDFLNSDDCKWFDPVISAKAMFDTINRNDFKSGDHIDILDVPHEEHL